MFSAPTKNKTTLFTMFSYPGSPKIEPKHWYLRCFCNTQKSTRSKNSAICNTLARPHVRNAVFYSVFEPPLKNIGIYSVFLENTCIKHGVNSDEFKDCIFHGNKLQKAKTPIFTAFLRNDLFKKWYFWTIFGFWSFPKTKKGVYPPPFHILNFKVFTKSKTWQFLELETRPGRHFLTVFTMFFAPALNFCIKKCNFKKYQKNH